MNAGQRLAALKALHTAIWLFFATCVIAIPIEAWQRRFDCALTFIVIVGVEVAALALNSWRCPLQGIAARYTSDRSGNFDIYLPAWLATRTMIIFGPLLAVGICLTATLWWMSGG